MRTAEARPVMHGGQVKWTLEQIEQTNQGRVRLDWLRFTVPLDAVAKVGSMIAVLARSIMTGKLARNAREIPFE